MNAKVKSYKKFSRVRTSFTDKSFQSSKALVQLEGSLTEGSKRRLAEYMRNLSTSRGVDSPMYDRKVERLLKEYALDKRWVNHQINYLSKLRDPDGFRFSRNLKIYSRIEDDMKRFSQSDYTSFRWCDCYQKTLEEIKAEFSKLNLNPLVFRCDNDIEDAVPKKDTHSGFTWIISGKKKKGEHMEQIYSKYVNEEVSALEKGSFCKPILIGFRTQGSGEYTDVGQQTFTCKHKLRVVSMIDIYQIIGELQFSKPIQDYLAESNYYAGGKDPKEIGRIISGFKSENYYFVSLDYSSYDQTISSWLIHDAFDIMKCAFHGLDERQLRLWDVIEHDFIHKDFIVDGGLVHSDKGVPSGSMFTQIIDTIVNRLMIKTYFKSLKSKCDMIIMGDDNLIFSNEPIQTELIATYVSKNFGIKVNADKSSSGVSMKDGVEFLSCFWYDHGRWREPAIILSKLLYSERRRNYSDIVGPEHVLFAAFLMYDLGVEKLIDVKRFVADYPISQQFVMDYVGDEYLPGALAYIRAYTRKSKVVRYCNY